MNYIYFFEVGISSTRTRLLSNSPFVINAPFLHSWNKHSLTTTTQMRIAAKEYPLRAQQRSNRATEWSHTRRQTMLKLIGSDETNWRVVDTDIVDVEDSDAVDDDGVVGGLELTANGHVLFYPSHMEYLCFNVDELREIARWMDELGRNKDLVALGL